MIDGVIKGQCPSGSGVGAWIQRRFAQVNAKIGQLNRWFFRHQREEDQHFEDQCQVVIRAKTLPSLCQRWLHQRSEDGLDRLLRWQVDNLASWLDALGHSIDDTQAVLKQPWASQQQDWFCNREVLQVRSLLQSLQSWKRRAHQALIVRLIMAHHAFVHTASASLNWSDEELERFFILSHASYHPDIVSLLHQNPWIEGRCIRGCDGHYALIPQGLSSFAGLDISLGLARWLPWLFRGRFFRYRLTHRLSTWISFFGVKKRLLLALERDGLDIELVQRQWQLWQRLCQKEMVWVAEQRDCLWVFSGFSRRIANHWHQDLQEQRCALQASLASWSREILQQKLPWKDRLQSIEHYGFLQSLLSSEDSALLDERLFKDAFKALMEDGHDAAVLLEAYAGLPCDLEAEDSTSVVTRLSRYAVGHGLSQHRLTADLAYMAALHQRFCPEFSGGQDVAELLHKALVSRHAWYQGLGQFSSNKRDDLLLDGGSTEMALVPYSTQHCQLGADTLIQKVCFSWHAWLSGQSSDSALLALCHFYERRLLRPYWSDAWQCAIMQWAQQIMDSDNPDALWRDRWFVLQKHFADFHQDARASDVVATWSQGFVDGSWHPLKQAIADAWAAKPTAHALRYHGLLEWLDRSFIPKGMALETIWPLDLALLDFCEMGDVLHRLARSWMHTGWLSAPQRCFVDRCLQDESITGNAAWPEVQALFALWQSLQQALLFDIDWQERLAPLQTSDAICDVSDLFHSILASIDKALAMKEYTDKPFFVDTVLRCWMERLHRSLVAMVRASLTLDQGPVIQERLSLLMKWLSQSHHSAYFQGWMWLPNITRKESSLFGCLTQWRRHFYQKLSGKCDASTPWLNRSIAMLFLQGVVPEHISHEILSHLLDALPGSWGGDDQKILRSLRFVLEQKHSEDDRVCLLESCQDSATSLQVMPDVPDVSPIAPEGSRVIRLYDIDRQATGSLDCSVVHTMAVRASELEQVSVVFDRSLDLLATVKTLDFSMDQTVGR